MKKILSTLATSLGLTACAQTPLNNTNSFGANEFIEQSFAGLQGSTQIQAETWGLGSEQRWSVDQDQGTLTWYFADGKQAVAPVQMIGTYYQGEFLWGWDHPSVKAGLDQAAHQVKAWGEEHNLPHLTERKVAISDIEAWKYTALAMRLDKASGAFRAIAGGGTTVFMTFGKVTVSKPN